MTEHFKTDYPWNDEKSCINEDEGEGRTDKVANGQEPLRGPVKAFLAREWRMELLFSGSA